MSDLLLFFTYSGSDNKSMNYGTHYLQIICSFAATLNLST